jgi:DNA-binding cell septation regulator SpoVG
VSRQQYATRPPSPAPARASAPPVAVDDIKIINKGSLRAFAKITIAGKLAIYDIRVVQQEGADPWIAMPQREAPARDGGKSRWFPVVEIIDEKLKEQIANAVLKAWRAQAA